MDLIDYGRTQLKGTGPLADRLRPQSFAEFLGQAQVLGEHSSLKHLITTGHVMSMIIWGPPGTGKTTFARLLANEFEGAFVGLRAIEVGAKDIKDEAEKARQRQGLYQQRTILFVDEIHRLNKAQQDVLLPYVEDATLTLIGATTENPGYEINSALLSRCRLVVFETLKKQDLLELVQRGFKFFNLSSNEVITDVALEAFCESVDGDGRQALNGTEVMVRSFRADSEKHWNWPLQESDLKSFLASQSVVRYDKTGDQHYDIISAFIKSIRGSDPDAGLYYLARMLKGGEDPKFIARRLVILASEDIGNADPHALVLATAGFQAVTFVGLPEAALNLAQVVCYLACAPKSNRSYEGIKKAQQDVEHFGSLPVPISLRSSQNSVTRKIGYGRDYKYSHDYEHGWVQQQYLPDELKDVHYYQPSEQGYEQEILQRVKRTTDPRI